MGDVKKKETVREWARVVRSNNIPHSTKVIVNTSLQTSRLYKFLDSSLRVDKIEFILFQNP